MNIRLIAIGCAVAAFLAMTGAWQWERHAASVARSERDAARTELASVQTARISEQASAISDYTALQTSCRADIVAAVGKGRTIERIIQPAPSGDPGAIVACELRDLIGQPGCGSVPPVADGGNP